MNSILLLVKKKNENIITLYMLYMVAIMEYNNWPDREMTLPLILIDTASTFSQYKTI